MREDHIAPAHDRPAAPGRGARNRRRRRHHACRRGPAAARAAAHRRPLPVGGVVWFTHFRGEHRLVAGGVHGPAIRDRRVARAHQTQHGEAWGLRGFHDFRAVRRDEEARGLGPCHGARRQHSVLRRAVGRARSRHLRRAGRTHRADEPQPRHHHGGGVARAVEHLHHRGAGDHAGRRKQTDHRRGQGAGAARPQRGPARARLLQP